MKKFILFISAIGFFLIGLSTHAHATPVPIHNESSNTPQLNNALEDPSQNLFSDWDPEAEMARMEQNMQKMMHFAASAHSQAWNNPNSFSLSSQFEDTGKDYQLRLRLPGIEKDKIDIESSRHQIRISGKQTSENQFQDDHSQRMEKNQSSFQQIIPLPENADEDTLNADYHQGILTVHLSKISPQGLPQKPGRKVAVK